MFSRARVWIQKFPFRNEIAPDLLSWIRGRHSNSGALSTNVSRRYYTIAGCGDGAMVMLALGLRMWRWRWRKWRIAISPKKRWRGMQEGVKWNHQTSLLNYRCWPFPSSVPLESCEVHSTFSIIGMVLVLDVKKDAGGRRMQATEAEVDGPTHIFFDTNSM